MKIITYFPVSVLLLYKASITIVLCFGSWYVDQEHFSLCIVYIVFVKFEILIYLFCLENNTRQSSLYFKVELYKSSLSSGFFFAKNFAHIFCDEHKFYFHFFYLFIFSVWMCLNLGPPKTREKYLLNFPTQYR